MPVLVVTLIGAIVKSADINGFSDPYVVLTLGMSKEKKKSKTIKKTLHPFWNEPVVLNTAKPGDQLHVEVWDWDRFKKDDFLGECYIELNDIPKTQYDYIDTHDLMEKGEVIGQICLGLHPRGMGSENPIKPKKRYIRIGGKDGRWSWESSSFWSRDFELTSGIDSNGNLFGKYLTEQSSSKKNAKSSSSSSSSQQKPEWHEIVNGKITPEGDVSIEEIKYYIGKENRHKKSDSITGKIIKKKKRSFMFEGEGVRKNVTDNDDENDENNDVNSSSSSSSDVGKKFSCRGEVRYTPIPIMFWKQMKKEEDEAKKNQKSKMMKFYSNFECVEDKTKADDDDSSSSDEEEGEEDD